MAATMASTGTPAYFVHAAEAVHGDLGMITRDDVLLALVKRAPRDVTGFRGIRGTDLLGQADNIHVNIFNISKINTETRGGASPRRD